MTAQKAKLDPKYLMEKPEIGDLLEKILIKYLVAGIFPETASQDSYLKVYNFVSHYANKDEEAGDLYVYFEEKIKAVSSELVKELTNKSNSEIIDLFIDVANRMDIFISFMSKTFSYVDFYYVKSKPEKKKLLTTALFIYRENIFKPVQKQLTEEVNKLLKEDRFGRKENRIKIKKVLSIMKTMDLTSPKIFKENNAVVWVNEKKDDNAENPIQKFDRPPEPVKGPSAAPQPAGSAPQTEGDAKESFKPVSLGKPVADSGSAAAAAAPVKAAPAPARKALSGDGELDGLPDIAGFDTDDNYVSESDMEEGDPPDESPSSFSGPVSSSVDASKATAHDAETLAKAISTVLKRDEMS